jgi:hypothetical protein
LREITLSFNLRYKFNHLNENSLWEFKINNKIIENTIFFNSNDQLTFSVGFYLNETSIDPELTIKAPNNS